MNPTQLQYFRDYAAQHFNGPLKPDQGTDYLLRLLDRYGDAGRLLDVACGPSTFFWANGFRTVASIVATDVSPEAGIVLAEVRATLEQRQCYRDAAALLGRPPESLDSLRTLPFSFRPMDGFGDWQGLGEMRFDTVISFGLWGLARNVADIDKFMIGAASVLAPGGSAIIASWRRHNATPVVTASLGEQIAQQHQFVLHDFSEGVIENDPAFASVVSFRFSHR